MLVKEVVVCEECCRYYDVFNNCFYFCFEGFVVNILMFLFRR